MSNHSFRENEKALIGAVLRDNTCLERTADIVTLNDFDWRCYQWAWKAILSLADQGMDIDTVTLGDELARSGQLDGFTVHDMPSKTGRLALAYVREIGEPQSAETYAQKIVDYSAKRYIERRAGVWVSWAINGRTSDSIVHDITKELSGIRTFSGKAAQHTQSIADAMSVAYDYTDRASKGEVVYVPTGLIDLDKILSGGMTAPDLIVIGARPGQGKTALLATITKNAADAGRKVVFFSMEMLNHQIAMRLLAMESGVSFDKQKSGKMSAEDWDLYTQAVARMNSVPIVLNDLPAITISRMRQELRRVEADLVVVDYLQLGGVDGKHDNRVGEIGEISRGLKAIAKEFGVPVLAAAQLSRSVEQRAGKRPTLADLRESGSIENDSDIVIFIYREKEDSNMTELIIAKHRNGPTGSVSLVYKPSLTRYDNVTMRFS